MNRQPAVLCAFLSVALSALHVYWARGGKAFAEAVVPTRSGTSDRAGEPLMQPQPAATWAVAAGLAMATLVVLRAGFTGHGKGSARLVALAFSLRAVGDFRYIGFTKRVKDTPFAARDSRIYSPLCIVIATFARRAAR